MTSERASNREESGLPGSEIVGAYGEQVRAAIVEGIGVGIADARRHFAGWCIATLVGAMVITAAVSWLVVSWVLSSAAHASSEFEVRRGDSTEVCTRLPDSPDTRPVFTCRTVL